MSTTIISLLARWRARARRAAMIVDTNGCQEVKSAKKHQCEMRKHKHIQEAQTSRVSTAMIAIVISAIMISDTLPDT
jgi:hypothetical protein